MTEKVTTNSENEDEQFSRNVFVHVDAVPKDVALFVNIKLEAPNGRTTIYIIARRRRTEWVWQWPFIKTNKMYFHRTAIAPAMLLAI